MNRRRRLPSNTSTRSWIELSHPERDIDERAGRELRHEPPPKDDVVINHLLAYGGTLTGVFDTNDYGYHPPISFTNRWL